MITMKSVHQVAQQAIAESNPHMFEFAKVLLSIIQQSAGTTAREAQS